MSNVFEKGLLGTGATIAARLNGPLEYYVTNVVQFAGTQVLIYGIPLGPIPYPVILAPPPNPGSPFPYGFDVEDP